MDLTSSDVQGYSDPELFWIVKNGIRLSGMPAFGKVESDEDIWTMFRIAQNRASERIRASHAVLRGPRNTCLVILIEDSGAYAWETTICASIWKGPRDEGAVTGQRSNQLNYVPSLFSAG